MKMKDEELRMMDATHFCDKLLFYRSLKQ